MEENKKKFTRCPLCNSEGTQLDNNPLVWYHSFTNSRGGPETHKWSVRTGRMFNLSATEDDTVV